jgi:hypothetical protein
MPITSRMYNKNVQSLEIDVIKLFGSFVIGAAGAVASKQGGGILSVTKLATAGQYKITLTDRFARILMAKFQAMGAAALAVGNIQILETPSTFQASVKTGGTITIQCLDFAGAAVNPASGAAIYFEIDARQSSIGRYDS